MDKIKLTNKEIDLLYFILKRQCDYGWDSCLGGHELTDKVAVKKYNKDMLMVAGIINKLRTAKS